MLFRSRNPAGASWRKKLEQLQLVLKLQGKPNLSPQCGSSPLQKKKAWIRTWRLNTFRGILKMHGLLQRPHQHEHDLNNYYLKKIMRVYLLKLLIFCQDNSHCTNFYRKVSICISLSTCFNKTKFLIEFCNFDFHDQ